MAKGKPTPEKSKIERDRPLAYSRRQKGADADGDDKDAPEADPGKTEAEADAENKADAMAEAPKAEAPDAKAEEPPAIEPPPSKGEPWPDATPQPMRPVEVPVRARLETVAMPAELVVGAPPTMPADASSIEEPPFMPGPRQIPGGAPGDPAATPGRAPAGDSRSLRMGNEFALVYRMQTALITRVGVIGTRGVWRVVEYPTPTSASNAYAKECSRFVSEGFSDYRD